MKDKIQKLKEEIRELKERKNVFENEEDKLIGDEEWAEFFVKLHSTKPKRMSDLQKTIYFSFLELELKAKQAHLADLEEADKREKKIERFIKEHTFRKVGNHNLIRFLPFEWEELFGSER